MTTTFGARIREERKAFGITLEKSATQGLRLREAREGLGLTQDEFAKRCGVHRKSQVNYEMDRRHPGESYWDALEVMGIDSGYIRSGERRAEHFFYPEMQRELMIQLLIQLGYSEQESFSSLHQFTGKLLEITDDDELTDETMALAKETAECLYRGGRKVVMLIEDATELDSSLLGEVLKSVDLELEKLDVKLPTEKKGRLVASIYRTSKFQGRIDTKLLADAVLLVK